MSDNSFYQESCANFQPKCQARVLLVPDSAFWVTGTIANAIAYQCKGLEAIVCSEPVLDELLTLHDGRFPFPLDVVHFQTPHIATRQFKNFKSVAACVATLHHVDSDASIEPAKYLDAVTTGCEYWRDYHSKFVCDPAKLVMVHYGLDVELFRPATSGKERLKARRRFGIEDHEFVVGFSAKRSSDSGNRKGINVLEALMEMSVEKNEKITWFVRGPGWQSLVDRLRARNAKIIYVPFLAMEKEVAESYRVLDAFVVTSRIEGGPYPLIEAMSSGVPVVSTPVGIALEVVKHMETGFVVPFDDPGATYSCLQRIRTDSHLRVKLIANGREIVCKELPWEKTLKAIPELYNVGIKNFQERTGNRDAASSLHAGSKFSRASLKKWIDAREFAAFSRFLVAEQCPAAACHFANRAIRCAPFDRSILSQCVGHSSLSMPYRAAKKMTSLWRRRKH